MSLFSSPSPVAAPLSPRTSGPHGPSSLTVASGTGEGGRAAGTGGPKGAPAYTLRRRRYTALDGVLREMARLVTEARVMPWCRALAARLAPPPKRGPGGVPVVDRGAAALAAFELVQERVAYLPDPARTELLQAPHVTLDLEHGDCDDMVTLFCALVEAAGVPSRFVVVGYSPLGGPGGPFDHVYAEVDLSDDPAAPRWIAADPTLDAPFGTALGAARRRVHTPDQLLDSPMDRLLDTLGLGCPSCSGAPFDPTLAGGLGCPGCGGSCGAHDRPDDMEDDAFFQVGEAYEDAGLGNPYGGGYGLGQFGFDPFGGGQFDFGQGFGLNQFGGGQFGFDQFGFGSGFDFGQGAPSFGFDQLFNKDKTGTRAPGGSGGGSGRSWVDDLTQILGAATPLLVGLFGSRGQREQFDPQGRVIYNPTSAQPPPGYRRVVDPETGQVADVPIDMVGQGGYAAQGGFPLGTLLVVGGVGYLGYRLTRKKR